MPCCKATALGEPQSHHVPLWLFAVFQGQMGLQMKGYLYPGVPLTHTAAIPFIPISGEQSWQINGQICPQRRRRGLSGGEAEAQLLYLHASLVGLGTGDYDPV